MRPHPRVRAAAVYLVAALAVLLLAVAGLSFRWGLTLHYTDFAEGAAGHLYIDHGVLRWSRYWGTRQVSDSREVLVERVVSPGPEWIWKLYDPGPVGRHVFLPLWFPGGVAALGAVVLWRYDYRERRRVAGVCIKCGYDLRGLAVGAKCPECGTGSVALSGGGLPRG